MEDEILQGALVAGFIPVNHVRSKKRDDLNRYGQIRAVFRGFEIEGCEGDSEPPAVDVECFA